MPLTDGLDDGGALGADGGAVGCVFNVAAGVDRAVAALQRRTYREVGLGDIGHVQHGDGFLAEFLFGHGGFLLHKNQFSLA